MKPFAVLFFCIYCLSIVHAQSPTYLPGLNWEDPKFKPRKVAQAGISSIKIDQFEGKGSRSRLTQSAHFEFDSAGLILQQVASVPGDTLSIQQYSYNENGVLNTKTIQDYQWHKTYKEGYRFTSLKEPYQIRSYELLQNKQRLLLNTRQYIYNTDSTLQIIRILENGQVIQLHRFEYDEYKRIVAESFEDPDGTIIKRVGYSYDEEDRISYVVAKGTVQTEFFYSFDKRGLPTEILWKENDRIKGMVKYAYNLDGTVAKMERVMSPTSGQPQYTTKVLNYETF